MDQNRFDQLAVAIAHGANRRSLVGAMAGGLGLAASGLLLPEWLVEDVAADQRNQRTHHHRQQQRRRQRHGSGAPGAFIKGVRMKVVANNGPLKINWWWWTLIPYSETFGPLDIAAGASNTVGKDALNLAVNFRPIAGASLPPDGFLYVQARNPIGTPDVSVYYGTGLELTNIASYQNVDQGVTLSVDAFLYKDVKVRLTIKRETDSDDYKEFTVTVGPPA